MKASKALEVLKFALTTLKATGENGFEGLLEICLSNLTGKNFRLAGSGSQHGMDGNSNENSCHIAFEAKLYKGKIAAKDVTSKVAEIIANPEPPNLWVLGATIEIKSQIVNVVKPVCEKNSIHYLILDWISNSSIPPLSAICVYSKDSVVEFLKRNSKDPNSINFPELILACEQLENSENYLMETTKIQSILNEPTLGLPLAFDNNKEWISSVTLDETDSRAELGQNLAVKSFKNNCIRTTLEDKVSQKLHEFDSELIALLGVEGSGKSCLFLNSWLSMNLKNTLLVMFTAHEVSSVENSNSQEKILIQQLIKQTKDSSSEFKEKRWINVFTNWRNKREKLGVVDSDFVPNLIVYIDGLNEYPSNEWDIWIAQINKYLSEISGKLIISCRQQYFTTNILQKSPNLKFYEIVVPIWSIEELKHILDERNISLDNLNQKVVSALRNPRLLSIALDLTTTKELENLNEINPARLLFEHIRKHLVKNPKISNVDQIKSTLTKVAKEYIDRKSNNEVEVVFDTQSTEDDTLLRGLQYVYEGRYIEILPEDSTLYRLNEEGVTLALALLVISQLQSSVRNKNDLSDSLVKVIEPIASLDETAEVVLTAIQISSIDNNLDDITTELIHEFLKKIQNINNNWYSILTNVARRKTKLQMDLLYRISTSKVHYRNNDLLVSTLCEVRDDEGCWEIMKNEINQWLSLFSLKPGMRMTNTRGKSEEEVANLALTEQEKLNKKVRDFSEGETNFNLEFMNRNDHLDTTDLIRNVFKILSGMPLEPHVEYLAAWKFGKSINPDFYGITDEFKHLIQFNNCDWEVVRKRFLKVTSFLNLPEVSKSGKWALVSILRALATEKDSILAHKITKELIKGRPSYPEFRAKENYCNTDPCDPSSEFPSNFEPTILRYEKLDFGKTYRSHNLTSEDLFLRDINAAFARFKPSVPINKHRLLFKKLLDLEGKNFYSLCNFLKSSSALITDGLIKKLKNKAEQLSKKLTSNENDDDYISLQELLSVILQNLSGPSQLKFLCSLDTQGGGAPFLSQLDLYKAGYKATLERLLVEVEQKQNKYKLKTLLLITGYSNTEITETACKIIEKLISHDDKSIRTEVMGIAAKYPHRFRGMIKGLVLSNWDANLLDPSKDRRLIFFGSKLLAKAEEFNIVAMDDIFTRIPPSYFGLVVNRLTEKHIKNLISLIDASILRLISNSNIIDFGEVENDNDLNNNTPPLLDTSKAQKVVDNPFSVLTQDGESQTDQPKFSWDEFDRFLETISRNSAYIILDGIDHRIIDICIEKAPEVVANWVDRILNKDSDQISLICNVGLSIAEGLSKKKPKVSVKLFEKLANSNSLINQTYGVAKISQRSLSIWRSHDSPEIDDFRNEYFSILTSDQELSTEVLTANLFDKGSNVEKIVIELINSNKPVLIARALTICGFGIDSNTSSGILTRYIDSKGVIGKAAKEGYYAYERNIWAEYWYSEMDKAKSKTDFWRFSVLFLEVVDGRFEVWKYKYSPQTLLMNAYWPSLINRYKQRLKKLEKTRSEKLFGDEKPNKYFIELNMNT